MTQEFKLKTYRDLKNYVQRVYDEGLKVTSLHDLGECLLNREWIVQEVKPKLDIKVGWVYKARNGEFYVVTGKFNPLTYVFSATKLINNKKSYIHEDFTIEGKCHAGNPETPYDLVEEIGEYKPSIEVKAGYDYKNRLGVVISIAKIFSSRETFYKFESKGGFIYGGNGKFFLDEHSCHDLVEEIGPTPKPELIFEAGNVYEDIKGRRVLINGASSGVFVPKSVFYGLYLEHADRLNYHENYHKDYPGVIPYFKKNGVFWLCPHTDRNLIKLSPNQSHELTD